MAFETDEERIFKTYVRLLTDNIIYSEYSKNFIRFRDEITGKIFEVSVKEKKSKKKV